MKLLLDLNSGNRKLRLDVKGNCVFAPMCVVADLDSNSQLT